MTATVDQFRELLPAFTETLVEEETVEAYLALAEVQMVTGLGDNADAAQVFLTAHLMSMAGIGPGAQAGQLAGFTNLKVGSLSLTRAEKVAMGEYLSSQYGQLYWLLAKKGGAGTAIMVTPGGCYPADEWWPGWPGQR